MKNKKESSTSIEEYIELLEHDESFDESQEFENMEDMEDMIEDIEHDYYSTYDENEEIENSDSSLFNSINHGPNKNDGSLYDKSTRDNFDYYEIYPTNSSVENRRNIKILLLIMGFVVYFSGITMSLPLYPSKEPAIGLYILLALLPLTLYIPCVSIYQNSRYLLAIKNTKKLTKLQENFKTGIEYDSNIIETLEKNHYRLYALGSSFVFKRIKQALIKQERILRIKKENIDTIIKRYLQEDLI